MRLHNIFGGKVHGGLGPIQKDIGHGLLWLMFQLKVLKDKDLSRALNGNGTRYSLSTKNLSVFDDVILLETDSIKNPEHSLLVHQFYFEQIRGSPLQLEEARMILLRKVNRLCL